MQKFQKDRLKEEFKQRIYKYIVQLVKFLSNLPKDNVTREITSQLMRSSTSIGANYFEARSASSKKDYQNFFTYSLKSANETKFWLTIFSESDLIPKQSTNECRWLLRETEELAKIFASSILTMKGRR